MEFYLTSVTLRTREIGVRMALGATKAHTTGLILRQGLSKCAVGIGVGALALWPIGRFTAGLPTWHFRGGSGNACVGCAVSVRYQCLGGSSASNARCCHRTDRSSSRRLKGEPVAYFWRHSSAMNSVRLWDTRIGTSIYLSSYLLGSRFSRHNHDFLPQEKIAKVIA
jgi:ABC-type antimicrobial peptide transport system permease subunit